MVRFSRFAFDDPRGSDGPYTEPTFHVDDPGCDDADDWAMTPPSNLHGDEPDQNTISFPEDDETESRHAA